MIEIKCAFAKMVPLEDIHLDPKNSNTHPEEQIDELIEQYKFQGIRHPIIISLRDGFVAAGEGRYLAAKKMGLTEFPCDYQHFENEEQQFAFGVADNAIQGWAKLDLGKIHRELPDLNNFPLERLAIRDFQLEPESNENDPDAVPEPPKEAKSKRGEIYILGNHRVMCGDSTIKEDVDKLMNGERADMVFTDPPYGIDLDTNYTHMTHKGYSKSINHRKVIGDEKEFCPKHLLDLADEVFIFGANYFCWDLPRGGSWVCWDKRSPDENNIGAVDGMFGSDFELCWSKKKHQQKIFRMTVLKSTNGGGRFKNHPRVEENLHPTQKPVALIEQFLDMWGNGIKSIIDLYLGSGSTLIACEKTNRKCFGMEIDPVYVDVIIERWENFTGKKAELLAT